MFGDFLFEFELDCEAQGLITFSFTFWRSGSESSPLPALPASWTGLAPTPRGSGPAQPPAAPLTRVQKLSRLDRSPRPPTLSFSLSLFLCTNSFCTLALPKKKKKSPLNDKVTCTFFFTRGRNSVLATAGKSTAFHKDVACVLLHRGLKQSAGCAQILLCKGARYDMNIRDAI